MRKSLNLDLWGGVLIRSGGILLIAGALLPWAWLPVAGLHLPWLGVMGPGIAVTAAGYLLVFKRLPWRMVVALGLAVLLLGAWGYDLLPVSVRGGLLALQAHVEPVNGLLARFNLPPLIVFDTAHRVPDLRGPGPALTLWGAVLALTGAVLRGRSALLFRARNICTACRHEHAAERSVTFCVKCGATMPGRIVCQGCRTLAEPGDLCCSQCGVCLSSQLEAC